MTTKRKLESCIRSRVTIELNMPATIENCKEVRDAMLALIAKIDAMLPAGSLTSHTKLDWAKMEKRTPGQIFPIRI